MKLSAICLTATFAAVTVPAFAEPAKIVGTVTDVFGPRFVVETATGKILVDIGPKGAGKVAIKRGEKIEIDGDRRQNELRARRVTLADGHAYKVGPRGTWGDWLLGRPAPGPVAAFGPAEAKKFATDKGYEVTGTPIATKEHFAVMATKAGSKYELAVHRDGRIDPRVAFGAAEAKKLALDKGYQLTSDPVAMKEHFRVAATKSGKSLDIDLHRNGTVVEHAAFGPDVANKLVTDKGYVMVGTLQPVDEHFELLGKKDGKFYELHAHRDGKLVRARVVQATDPKWGSLVR
jgi:hypothetical protein